MLAKRKPHESGVVVEHKRGGGWHWAATPAEARQRYLDVVEQLTAASPDEEILVQLVEFGEVVEETNLGRDGSDRTRARA